MIQGFFVFYLFTIQTQEIRIIEDSRLSPAETFDLQGRRIQDNPKHGVYIKNRKKVVK